jgi:DNA-binding response OmpR family regulator
MYLSSPVTAASSASLPLHVVLLEDDEVLRDHVLTPNLRKFGFDVVGIGHAEELADVFARRQPDIVVLDVGSPNSDGFSVSRQLRTQHREMGIVMLTGRGESVDHVRGLSEGADSYLSKPVDIDVLVATLHSLARRVRMQSTAPATAQGWVLDNGGWALRSPAGSSVTLSKSESRLMGALLKSPNAVVPRENLIQLLTDNVFEFDPHRLDSIIHRLRRKVRGAVGEQLPLNSVHGEGYVIVQP